MLPKKSMAMVQTAPRKLEARDLPIPQIADDSAMKRPGFSGGSYL
jgi:hypothetical protein